MKKTIPSTSYVNVKDVGSRRVFILGTDNFGRDVLTELVAAIKTSLKIGFIAGLIATTIGLSLGLIAGYLGGIIDDFILFITNLFTVIPSFILLILISYSIGKNARGVMMVAFIIGLTSWTWTTRSVRSQVISLRNRDHVNLSKLSGHSLFRIILTDILPYIASYVVMALILQISSRDSCRGTVIHDRAWPCYNDGIHSWSYDELGDVLQCTSEWGLVGLFSCHHFHRTDFIFLKSDEYGPGSDI
ncbi:ABC transporter permease [Lacrimispora xylanisolvens]|uniref:ABC transporter permease n=1 Tax=Lacrimispora xylanisolvens TaxID=384636 RepID=UPI002402D06A